MSSNLLTINLHDKNEEFDEVEVVRRNELEYETSENVIPLIQTSKEVENKASTENETVDKDSVEPMFLKEFNYGRFDEPLFEDESKENAMIQSEKGVTNRIQPSPKKTATVTQSTKKRKIINFPSDSSDDYFNPEPKKKQNKKRAPAKTYMNKPQKDISIAHVISPLDNYFIPELQKKQNKRREPTKTFMNKPQKDISSSDEEINFKSNLDTDWAEIEKYELIFERKNKDGKYTRFYPNKSCHGENVFDLNKPSTSKS